MKLSKKFIEDLHKIGEDAFIEKNQWIGKLVPEIIIDNLQKRGISQKDIEGCVILTLDEANLLFSVIDGFFDLRLPTTKEIVALNKLKVRVEQIVKTEECND